MSVSGSLVCPWILACFLSLSGAPAFAQTCDAGHALDFDGLDDRVRVPYSTSFPVATFTLTAWIKTPSPTGTFMTVVAYGEDANTDNAPWAVYVLPDGTLTIGLEDSSDLNAMYDTNRLVADDHWHHVAAARASNGNLTVFIDGELVSVFQNTVVPSSNSTQEVSIGSHVGNLGSPPQMPQHFFAGTIDEVTMWSAPLDAAEICQLFNGAVRDVADVRLVGYWDLNDASGQTATDRSPAANHGSLGNDPSTDPADPIWISSTAPVCPRLRWRLEGTPIAGGPPVGFRAVSEPAESGNPALVFISLGDGSGSGGIPIPRSGGRKLALDLDAVFQLWLATPPVIRRVILAGCAGSATTPVSIPSVATGMTIYYAGFSIGTSGDVVSVTETESFTIQ